MSSILNRPAVGPGAFVDVYEELAKIGAKTFSRFSPQDEAANEFLNQYNKKKEKCDTAVTSDLQTNHAELQTALKYENGRVEVLFKDAKNILRTKAPSHYQRENDADLHENLGHDHFATCTYHRTTSGVDFARGPVASDGDDVWRRDANMTSRSNMIAHFRPLWEDTVTALVCYVENDLISFGKAVLINPVKILSDLLERLNWGPLFDALAANTIITGFQDRLRYGAGKHDILFRLGVDVIANNLLTAFTTPHHLWNYYEMKDLKTNKEFFEASLVHPIKFAVLPDVFRNFDKILEPPPLDTIELDVYANALFTAMLVEGALKAANKVDASNERHIQHVTFGVNMGFAAASAVFASVPLGPAAIVPALVEPIKEYVLVRAGDGYATGVISAGIERLAKRICSRATEGTIVPGLFNQVASDGETIFYPLPFNDPIRKAIMKERTYWGDEFVKHFNVIRGFA